MPVPQRGQLPAIDLAVGGERYGIDDRQGLGHHVIGQPLPQKTLQVFGREPPGRGLVGKGFRQGTGEVPARFAGHRPPVRQCR